VRAGKAIKSVVFRKLALAAVICAIGSTPAVAQFTAATILEIEVQSLVAYTVDGFDTSKFATDPNRTTSVAPRNFGFNILVGDIAAVNGRPARGTMVVQQRAIALTPTANPGQAEADTVRTSVSEALYEIQQADGTPVGNIHTLGFTGGVPPVGALEGIGNFAIAGGTGAFLGARGQMHARSVPIPIRNASVTEDPARRRMHGGGRVFFVFQLLPLTRPEIVTSPSGPAIFHADFSPVTAARPARRGEILIIRATGLGPTRPGVNPGQSFPLDAAQEVNSPVEVSVAGRAAEVVNRIGWPGLTGSYRVDIRVPDGISRGMATVQMSAAWITGPDVEIPIQ